MGVADYQTSLHSLSIFLEGKGHQVYVGNISGSIDWMAGEDAPQQRMPFIRSSKPNVLPKETSLSRSCKTNIIVSVANGSDIAARNIP